MKDQSKTYGQMNLWDTPNVISSPASVPGPAHSGTPDGATIEKYGPAPLLASLSPRQAKEAGLLTSGTYGRHGNGSSGNGSLPSSWANRLRKKTALLGSTLFNLTWKDRVTPSGRRVFALVGSARRTSGKGCTSWRTPDANQRGGDYSDPDKVLKRIEAGHQVNINDQACLVFAGWPTPATQNADGGANPSGENNGGFFTLQTAAGLASWATPVVRDHRNSGGDGSNTRDLPRQANLSPWPTCAARDWKSSASNQHGINARPLNEVARLTLSPWGTPRSNNANGAGNPERNGGPNGRIEDQVQLMDTGGMPSGSPVKTGKRGQLNPALSRWLMGLDATWDALAPYSKEWDMVQRKFEEYSGDREQFSLWLVRIGLADCGVTETQL